MCTFRTILCMSNDLGLGQPGGSCGGIGFMEFANEGGTCVQVPLLGGTRCDYSYDNSMRIVLVFAIVL